MTIKQTVQSQTIQQCRQFCVCGHLLKKMKCRHREQRQWFKYVHKILIVLYGLKVGLLQTCIGLHETAFDSYVLTRVYWNVAGHRRRVNRRKCGPGGQWSKNGLRCRSRHWLSREPERLFFHKSKCITCVVIGLHAY